MTLAPLFAAGPVVVTHARSVFTLVMLVAAVWFARAGRIEAHRWTMIGLFLGSLVITGLFTLVPGRTMRDVVFGADVTRPTGPARRPS